MVRLNQHTDDIDLNEFQLMCKPQSSGNVAVQSIATEHNITGPSSRLHTSKRRIKQFKELRKRSTRKRRTG